MGKSNKKTSLETIYPLLKLRGFELTSPIQYQNKDSVIHAICSNGHTITTSYSKLKYYGCNQCSSHFKSEQQRKDELEIRNLKLLDSYQNSTKINKFQCTKCQHIFTTMYYRMLLRKIPCPKCRSNRPSPQRIDFNIFRKDLLKEDYTYLQGEYVNNRSKIQVRCPENHIVSVTRIGWLQKQRCRICSSKRQGKIKYDIEFIKNFLNQNGLTLLDIEKRIITVQCSEGHITKRKWYHTFKYKRFCSSCKINKPERELLNFFKELKITKKHRIRGIIGRQEIDIYLPNHDIGIEFNGLFWHSDYILKDKEYHKKKQDLCEKKGIELITIWQDEWEHKKHIVQSILKARLALNPIEGLKNFSFCETLIGKKEIDFFKGNSLHGISAKATHSVSLIKGNKIYSVLSYSFLKDTIHLYDFCEKLDYSIKDGFMEMINFLETKYAPKKICMTIDRRYFPEKMLVHGGFKKQRTTLKFKWTDFQTCSDKKDTTKKHQYKIFDNGRTTYVKKADRG